MVVKWGRLCSGYRPAMSTETLGDIASANYFYLRTLCMNHCALQHIKSPLWPMKKLGNGRSPGFMSPALCRRLYIDHLIMYKLQIQSMNPLI